MNYHKINHYDIANGEGIRVSLFVSGCKRRCLGCFNPETWDPNSGYLFTQKEVDEILEALKPDYITGFSLLGGEPFDEENVEELIKLIRIIKINFPNKDIWCWSGYTYEELLKNNSELLKMINVLIDGPFKQEYKDLRLKWRGSSNQRIINVTDSFKEDKIVLNE